MVKKPSVNFLKSSENSHLSSKSQEKYSHILFSPFYSNSIKDKEVSKISLVFDPTLEKKKTDSKLNLLSDQTDSLIVESKNDEFINKLEEIKESNIIDDIISLSHQNAKTLRNTKV